MLTNIIRFVIITACSLRQTKKKIFFMIERRRKKYLIYCSMYWPTGGYLLWVVHVFLLIYSWYHKCVILLHIFCFFSLLFYSAVRTCSLAFLQRKKIKSNKKWLWWMFDSMGQYMCIAPIDFNEMKTIHEKKKCEKRTYTRRAAKSSQEQPINIKLSKQQTQLEWRGHATIVCVCVSLFGNSIVSFYCVNFNLRVNVLGILFFDRMEIKLKKRPKHYCNQVWTTANVYLNYW